MAGHDEDRDLYGDPFKITAPPRPSPNVDTWWVLDRETGHQLGSVRLFRHRDNHPAVRVARFWAIDTGSGPVALWNERTGEVVY